MQYQLIDGSDNILNIEEGLDIPNDSNNRHFQEYVKWLSEGNSPLPAENKIAVPDYSKFWDDLVESDAYKESILPNSRKKVAANMSFTLFLNAIADAKLGRVKNHTQELLDQIVIDCNLTENNKKEILSIIKSNSIPLKLNTEE